MFNAQGFPPDYAIAPELGGKPLPKSDQIRACGNAVPPQWPEALVRANLPELCAERGGEAVA